MDHPFHQTDACVKPPSQKPSASKRVGPLPSGHRHSVAGAVVFLLFTVIAGRSGVWASPPPPPRSIVQLAQLHLGSKTPARTSSLRSWAQEVRLRTSVRITHEPTRVRASSTKLLRYPVLILAGAGALPPLASAATMRLREHLTSGGLLIIDDVGRAGPSAAFDRDVRRIVRRIMGRSLSPVPSKSVIYRTFYRLSQPVGRRADSRILEGVQVGKRWAVLYNRNDLLGAFKRSTSGGPALPVLPGGERQRELAWRLGVNLVVYAVSLDYKNDHTHTGHLLRRKRGR